MNLNFISGARKKSLMNLKFVSYVFFQRCLQKWLKKKFKKFLNTKNGIFRQISISSPKEIFKKMVFQKLKKCLAPFNVRLNCEAAFEHAQKDE